MSRPRRKQLRSRHKRIYAALLIGAVICMLLPSPATRWMMNLVQVLVPLQDAATRASDTAAGALASVASPRVSRADMESVQTENDALRHTVAALRTKIDGLEKTNHDLAGIRRIGLPHKLIYARVVAQDVLAWRESELLDVGTLRGVRPGAAVVSDHFAVSLGKAEGVMPGQAVLAAEALVGTVEHAGTHTARVRLVSDPATRMAVLLAPPDRGPLDAEFWLVGSGGGEARVQDVDHRYVKAESGIQAGYRVMTARDDERLPVSIVIGTVKSVEPDPDNPLLYSLVVTPAVDTEKLRRVYVVDSSPAR